MNLLDLLGRACCVVARDRFRHRSRNGFCGRSRGWALMVRTHRVVERVGRRARAAARTAATGRRNRRNRCGCRMISATTGTGPRSHLRNTARSSARSTAASAGSRSDATAAASRAAGRGHRHHRSTAGTASASAGHRHHAHGWLWNPLPIFAGVDDRAIVAVHRGLGRHSVFVLGLLAAVMMPASTSGFVFTSATFRLASAVATAKFVGDFLQARSLAAARVTA